MRTKLYVMGLLLVATALALAEMRTWTFQQSGKSIEAEVVTIADDTVTMKLPDGNTVTVRLSYLTESNRIELAAERAKQWKEVEVVRLEELLSVGRIARCTVKGGEVNGVVLIQLLPESVQQILISRNQQAAKIASLSAQIENSRRAISRADAVTPTGVVGDPTYVDAVMAQRARVNLAGEDLKDANANLDRLRAAYTDYLDTTKAATIVKIRKRGTLYGREPVWECPDPKKTQQ
jgi:hypothetical protein